MAAITICRDFEAQKNKVSHCFHCFSIYLLWSDWTRCHDLSFLNVELLANFFTLLFHFHQRLFSPSSLSAIRVVSSAYVLLLLSCFSHVQVCDTIDGSPPGSCVRGILQARILKWAAIFFSNECRHAKLLQSCPTLCDPADSSPPGCSVHRVL